MRHSDRPRFCEHAANGRTRLSHPGVSAYLATDVLTLSGKVMDLGIGLAKV